MTELSTKQMAEALGRSERRVQQLAAEGIITRSAPGRYPLSAVADYVAFIEAARGPADLQAERVRLTRAQADLAEVTLAKKRGDLLAREDVDAAVTAAFARVRARLLALPSKVAAEAAAEGEPGAVTEIIRLAVFDALAELAQTTPEDLLQG